MNFENDGGRQAGTVGILDYVEAEASAAGGAADEFTIVNPDWAEGKLYISGQNVSPDYNFIDGPEFEISFKVHPGSNNDFYDSPDWAAVVFGATEKNKFVNASDGFGILFRNDGQVQVFDGTVAIYGSRRWARASRRTGRAIASSSINFLSAGNDSNVDQRRRIALSNSSMSTSNRVVSTQTIYPCLATVPSLSTHSTISK